MIYLYALQVQNTIKYIGLTSNPSIREKQHRRKKPNPHIFSVLETFDDGFVTIAAKRETELIEKYDTFFSGWNKSPGGEYESSSGYNRKGIGGVKKGSITWNKGKKGCFSEETIQKFCSKRKGVVHSSKVDETTVREIRQRFVKYSPSNSVTMGMNMPNGRKLSKEREFANLYHEEYKITNTNLYNIVSGKSWKNIT